MRIKNLVKLGNYLAGQFWEQTNSKPTSYSNIPESRREIQRHTDSVEAICAQHQAHPADLPDPSRRVYCWLKFLAEEDNLVQHLAALAQARAIVDRRQPQLDRPLNLHLMGMNSLWHSNEYKNLVLLRVNEGFLPADRKVWEALIGTALHQRHPKHDHLVRGFAESEEFSEVLFELESFAALPATASQGQHHDLEESFHRVNQAYFGGSIARPNLVWTRTQTFQTFGHYQPGRDLVTLSLSLDQPEIPSSLVDYLMYHELLHKKHGTTVVNGRRVVHTSAFKRDEQGFLDYRTVRRQLEELATGLRARARTAKR